MTNRELVERNKKYNRNQIASIVLGHISGATLVNPVVPPKTYRAQLLLN